MVFRLIKNDFTAGVIDPEAIERSDMDFYPNAVAQGDNVVCKPKGGMPKRDALAFDLDCTDAGNLNLDPTQNFRMFRFDFGLDQEYTVVVDDALVQFLQDGVLIDTVASPFTNAQVAEFTYLQAFDTLILFHEDVETEQVVRTNPTTFVIATLTFDVIPLHQFVQDKDTPTKTMYLKDDVERGIMYSATRIAIEDPNGFGIGAKAFANISGGTIGSVTVEDGGEGYGTGTTASAIGMNGGGTSATLTVVLQSGEITAINVSVAGSGFSDGDFLSTDEGQFIELENGQGRARIVEYFDETAVLIDPVIPFPKTGIYVTSEIFLDRGYENVWSGSRGWPRTGVIFKGRMVLGGSKSLPDTFWASKAGLFFNFDNTRPELADFGFSAVAESTTLNRINALVRGRVIEMYTDEAEWTLTGTTFSPTDFNFNRFETRGAKEAIRPVRLEDATVYVGRLGEAIRETVFSDPDKSFITNNVSILADSQIDNPIDMDVRQNIEADEANYIVFVNSDGTAAVFCTQRRQNVTAFTKMITPGATGLIKAVSVEKDVVFFMVQRTVDSSDLLYLEHWEPDNNFDSSLTGTGSSTSISGLDHLEGEVVKVLVDGALLADETVSSGSITPDNDPDGLSFEVGLEYLPTIVDLPIHFTTDLGSSRGKRSRIVGVKLSFLNTQSCNVNGEEVLFQSLGDDLLDVPITEFTGLKVERGFRGWDREGQLTLTQTVPLKFHIRGYVKEVDI